jgi:hypothetical protein
MIVESQHILATTKLPEGRSERADELLTAAVSLAHDLLAQSPATTPRQEGWKNDGEARP